MELIPAVQKYDWGKKGESSLVAKLAKGSSNIEVDGRYAELWLGTHPNGPSHLKGGNGKETGLLSDYIKSDPGNILGPKILEKFGPELPFLFKVLSVEKALSIQAHPDKELALKLHQEFPHLYKDPNHKPEMAIALTPFEMMCGFRSMEEILGFLNGVEELRELVGGEEVIKVLEEKRDKDSLRRVFQNLMESNDELVKERVQQLLHRLDKMSPKDQENWEVDLVKRLNSQFPGDVGIFCAYFLQHFTLMPGQASFLPANEPHCYIYGDCMECMAASDNVVRAGLTPKFKDVPTLCSMLSYETGRNWVLDGREDGNGKFIYDAPVDEFNVVRYANDTPFTVEPSDSCSILICVEGAAKVEAINSDNDNANLVESMNPGTLLFLPYNLGLKIVPCNNEKVVLYQAIV